MQSKSCITLYFFYTFAGDKTKITYIPMGYMDKFTKSEDYRRDELIRIIEHSVENLTLQELEALYYDMTTKNFIND